MTYDRPVTLARGYDVPDPNGQPARHNEKTDNNDTKKVNVKRLFQWQKTVSHFQCVTHRSEKRKNTRHIFQNRSDIF